MQDKDSECTAMGEKLSRVWAECDSLADQVVQLNSQMVPVQGGYQGVRSVAQHCQATTEEYRQQAEGTEAQLDSLDGHKDVNSVQVVVDPEMSLGPSNRQTMGPD